jgi:hypothetical protein
MHYFCNAPYSLQEFLISTIEQPNVDVLYALEESSCLCRYFCTSLRPFHMDMTANAGGPQVASYERKLCAAAAPCKCCCFQTIETFNASGAPVGEVCERERREGETREDGGVLKPFSRIFIQLLVIPRYT